MVIAAVGNEKLGAAGRRFLERYMAIENHAEIGEGSGVVAGMWRENLSLKFRRGRVLARGGSREIGVRCWRARPVLGAVKAATGGAPS